MTLRTGKFLIKGIALLAFTAVVALLISPQAATQQRTAPMPTVVETQYTPAGTAQLSTNATIAWFIATPKSGDPYPVACRFVGEAFACKKGSFQ
jgi:hypothetical protein